MGENHSTKDKPTKKGLDPSTMEVRGHKLLHIFFVQPSYKTMMQS